MQTNRISLRCAEPGCHKPFGYLALTECGFVIEIESEHSGIKHRNVIPISLNTETVAVESVSGKSLHSPGEANS